MFRAVDEVGAAKADFAAVFELGLIDALSVTNAPLLLPRSWSAYWPSLAMTLVCGLENT